MIELLNALIVLSLSFVGITTFFEMIKQVSKPNWRKQARLINTDWRL